MTRILIVDDKEENLYYLQALLTGHGCIVDTARHGAEALIRARQVRPDLVVSDLLMPVMDGYTLLRHWKADARLKPAPFIVYTATYTEEADERLALDLGADAFILKPAEPEDFIARLQAVQARATAATPVPPKGPVGDEKTLLKVYSETLIRKLEEKTLQLEETNRALQRDIAERKAVEAELRRREEEFRTLTETIPQIVWMARPDGWHTHFNQRWLDYTGLALERSLGVGWSEAFHPDDRPHAEKRWQEATAGGQAYETEYRLRRADGVYHWMLSRAVPLRDAGGTIVKWFGTCTDIEELKQAHARIGEQAALLDQTQDAVIVRDLQHRILYWNKGAERIYGWTAAEALGRTVQELFHRDPASLQAAMETLLRQGTWSGESCHLTKTRSEVTIEGRWSLIRDEQGSPRSVLAVNTDVTERKRIEAQFLRAQRLESVGALAGGVAHDLNNMLAPIVMGVSLLKSEETDPDRLRTIELMERSALRGTNLVKQVLSFTRGVDASRVPLHLREVVAEFSSFASTTFPKHVAVQVDIPDDTWNVLGNSTQLQQVLLNLGVNARDAMPDGGTLRIAARNRVVDTRPAGATGAIPTGNYVVLTVSDTGTGMAPDVLGKIFEPFYSTKGKGEGTGLGLSTTRAIVRSHGGFIEVASTPGQGTVFQVSLPADTIGARAAAAAVAVVDLPRGNGELVLVVDDESSILNITRQTLEAFGYRVVTAPDGTQAIGVFALHRTEIAVVITDIMMPVMDGVGFATALRRLDPHARIIAASGLSSAPSPERLAQAGIEHFLGKPYTAEELLTLLRQALA